MMLQPTHANERIVALDLLRGFSLLGIFIANMLFFHTPYIYIDPFSWFTTPSDQATFKWITVFVQGSFYPIFAILFGYGINMQYEKALRTARPFAPVLAKRLSIMLLFGFIHALLIWAGDILVSYAVMGFALLLLVRLPGKWLAPIAAILYIIPMGGLYLLLKFFESVDPSSSTEAYVDIHQIELSISAYAHGSFADIFAQRFMEWLLIGVGSGLLLGAFTILPLISFGAVLSKWKVIERAGELKTRLSIAAIICIPVGIWIKSFPFTKAPTASYQLLQETIGGVLLALGYIAVILLLAQLPIFITIFRPIAKAGRMSLTTYITQSIVATLIFYNYGLGLYGKVDLATGTWMAVGIFVIQVILAELWFHKYKMGPLEALWRRLTYGKPVKEQ